MFSLSLRDFGVTQLGDERGLGTITVVDVDHVPSVQYEPTAPGTYPTSGLRAVDFAPLAILYNGIKSEEAW